MSEGTLPVVVELRRTLKCVAAKSVPFPLCAATRFLEIRVGPRKGGSLHLTRMWDLQKETKA